MRMELKLQGSPENSEDTMPAVPEVPTGQATNGFLSSVGVGGNGDIISTSHHEDSRHAEQQNGNGNCNGNDSDESMEADDNFDGQTNSFALMNGSTGVVHVPAQVPHYQQQHQGFQSGAFNTTTSPVATMRLRQGVSRQTSVPANFNTSKILNQRQPNLFTQSKGIDEYDRSTRSRRQQSTYEYWIKDSLRWLGRRTKLDALLMIGACIIAMQLVASSQIRILQSQTATLQKELYNTRYELNQKFYLIETSGATIGVKQQAVIEAVTKLDHKMGDVESQFESLQEKVNQMVVPGKGKPEATKASGGLFSSFGFGSVDDEKSRFMLDDELVGDAVLHRWRENLQDLKSSYPSQSREFWTQISAAVESTMSTDVPSKPASIVIVSKSTSDGSYALEFADSLASSINTAFDPKYQNIKQLGVATLNEAKGISFVHEDLKSYLNSQGKAVVVENIEDFRRKEHLFLFHAFCENSNLLAYDTRASFIFTMKSASLVESKHDWTHWEGQRIVRESLQYVWRSALDDDKRDAIISRVCAYVVLFNDSDDSPLM